MKCRSSIILQCKLWRATIGRKHSRTAQRVGKALILCDKKRIVLSDLGVQAQSQSIPDPEHGLSFTIDMSGGGSLQDAVRAAQKSLITEGLRLSSGSIKYAAARLGVTRDQLKYMMKSLGISRR